MSTLVGREGRDRGGGWPAEIRAWVMVVIDLLIGRVTVSTPAKVFNKQLRLCGVRLRAEAIQLFW